MKFPVTEFAKVLIAHAEHMNKMMTMMQLLFTTRFAPQLLRTVIEQTNKQANK
jgi:hypothetical protein